MSILYTLLGLPRRAPLDAALSLQGVPLAYMLPSELNEKNPLVKRERGAVYYQRAKVARQG